MTLLFDSHLCLPATLDALHVSVDEYADACAQAGVTGLLSVTSDVSLFEANRALVVARSDLTLMRGYAVHPLYCSAFDDATLHELVSTWWPIADVVGEIGLDFHAFDASYGYAGREKQIEVFHKQLEAAVAFNKPLVVHTRAADEATLEILTKHVPRDHVSLIVHCWSSGVELAQQLLARFDNVFFGIAGNVTFKQKSDWGISSVIPLDRLLLETDAPFLSPVRGKPNTSTNLHLIAAKVAALKGVAVETLVAATQKNVARALMFSAESAESQSGSSPSRSPSAS